MKTKSALFIILVIIFISLNPNICYSEYENLKGEIAIVSVEASSSLQQDNGPEKVLPGKSGFWYSSSNLPAWITVTLEKPQEINAVYINFGLGAMRYAIDYKIEFLDITSQTWKILKDITDNKNEETVEIFTPVETTKLRLSISKTYQPDRIQRIDEIRLYDLPSQHLNSIENLQDFDRSIAVLLNKAHTRISSGESISSVLKDSSADLNISENGDFYFLTSSQYRIILNKKNGFLSSLISLNPTIIDIVKPMESGMLLYVWCQNANNNWFEIFDKFKMQKNGSGEDDLGKYLELTGDIFSTSKNLSEIAQGKIRYRIYKDIIGIKIDLTYLKTDENIYEIGILQAYDPSIWNTQIYPGTSWHLELPATDTKRHILFFADSKDNSYEPGVWHGELAIGGHGPNVSYPYGILENESRYFLWGYRDLGAFTILAPGNREHNPSLIIRPKGIIAGEKYSFDFFYKFFPKPENTYTDVVRWYAQNVYSTDPVAQGIVTMPKDLPHRTLPEGNYGGYGFTWSTFSEYFPNAYKENEAAMLKLKMTNIHNAYWYDIAETYPTEGEWYIGDLSTRKVSAEALKKDLARLKSEGFNNYLYFRQLFNSFGLYDDKPPYKRWQKFYKDGRIFSYANIWHSVDPNLAKRLGLVIDNKKMGWPYADFYNEEFRNWYIQRVKDCVTYYNLDGVYWDMGWMDIQMGYTATDPIGGSGIHNGILRVQYEIYKWLKSFNPPKYVIMNLSLCSPSSLYADAVMFEGGNVPKRTVEAQKAFNTEIVNLSYSDSYRESTPEEHIRTIMRAMSYGVSWGGHGYEFFEHPDERDPAHKRHLGLYLLPLTELASFSALSNNIPLVTESHSIVVKSVPEVTASLWASDKVIMVTIYNDSESKQKYEILVDKEIITKYLKDKGKLNLAFQSIPPDAILYLGKDGKPISKVIVLTDKNEKYYILKGEIDPHHFIGIKR